MNPQLSNGTVLCHNELATLPATHPVSTPNTFITANSYSFDTLDENPKPTQPKISIAPAGPKLSKSGSDVDTTPQSLPQSIPASVCFEDTEAEGRPSIYLFIFVNPLSGDRKGNDLVNLPIQHFRLRRLPQVQVEIHNILDEKDRAEGIAQIKMIESRVSLGKLPPISQATDSDTNTNTSHNSQQSSLSDNSYKNTFESEPEGMGKLSPAARTRHIHVWSAGGDGTVMSVFDLLVTHSVNLDLIFFSCIPFGTGNDFSQVLGWGRTVPNKDILGSKLQNLEQLVTERLESSEAARLDIWKIDMISHDSGYVKVSGPNRKDGHDVTEVKTKLKTATSIHCKMCNYMSIGVQGYVGSGFENHRAGKRLMNMFVYASESSKWVFLRHFPPVTRFIQSIVQNGNTVLECPSPSFLDLKDESSVNSTGIATLTKHPIDFVIQNIPHIWGREVDLWGEAESGLESVKDRAGPTDPNTWNQQLANDGKMEIMVINTMYSYLKKLANIRSHVSRIGQFETRFDIHFRPPLPLSPTPTSSSSSSSSPQPSSHEALGKPSFWANLRKFFSGYRQNKYEKDNIVCIMCDGEFYTIKDPKEIKFDRFAQIWTLGKSDQTKQGRLVTDELAREVDHQ
ncbi:ATP-NAD kinase-like domain-containing protein [Spinellus fusiger]|nr:ATP-NAD kinase-like domain-containing protein [Spinellus fusiger]